MYQLNGYLTINYREGLIASSTMKIIIFAALPHKLWPSKVALKANNLWLTATVSTRDQWLHFDLFNALSPRLNPLGLHLWLLLCECILLSKSRSLKSRLTWIRLACFSRGLSHHVTFGLLVAPSKSFRRINAATGLRRVKRTPALPLQKQPSQNKRRLNKTGLPSVIKARLCCC